MGLGSILGKLKGLFGDGGQEIPQGVPGVGDGGLGGGGGGNPNAAGDFIGDLFGGGDGGGGGPTSQQGIRGALNNQKMGNADFLARGGGRREGNSIMDAMRRNALYADSPIGKFMENRGEGMGDQFLSSVKASEGLGPGGGLGVNYGVDEYSEANPYTLDVDKDASFLKKLIGKIALGAGMAGDAMTGGASLGAFSALGGIADKKLSGAGGMGKYNTGTGQVT